MRATMMKLLNPFMKWLLRSPLHPIISGSYLLITITGRKSGNLYTTPVQYRQQETQVYVVTSAKYKWWKNLLDGAEVTLQLRGQSCTAFARPFAELEKICEFLHILYPSMSPEQVQQLAPSCVALEIELQPELAQVP